MRKALVALILLSACAGSAAKTGDVRFEMQERTVVFHVEIARTTAEQERGLMARTSLPQDHGMLFVWNTPAVRQFWMKDTLIPLDLVSIRAGRVVGIAHMVPCKAEPCPLTTTPPVDAALEIGAGVAQARGIEIGALADSSVLG